MTVNAVRLNHAVLFVADLERSRLLHRAVRHGGRGPRAPRQRRVPAAAPLGQPPRPRPLRRRRRRRPKRAAASACTTWPGSSTPSTSSRRPPDADSTRLHRRVQPRRHQERLRRRPRRQRVRAHVDAPPRPVGRRTRTPPPSTTSTSPARSSAGAASAPPPSSSRSIRRTRTAEPGCSPRGGPAPTQRLLDRSRSATSAPPAGPSSEGAPDRTCPLAVDTRDVSVSDHGAASGGDLPPAITAPRGTPHLLDHRGAAGGTDGVEALPPHDALRSTNWT